MKPDTAQHFHWHSIATGDEIAHVFADLHRSHDVVFHFGTQVREFRGSGRVSSVLLTDGTELPADTVIVGVGARPNTDLAEDAGLAVDNGILVDESLRTSDPIIYAAGDVANAYHPLLTSRLRVEHWANALNGGPAAARAMLGQPVSYDRLPGAFDRVVVRGDLTKREFIAFWTAGGRVLAGMNVNVWDVIAPIQRLIRSGRPIDPDRLADPDTPLDEL